MTRKQALQRMALGSIATFGAAPLLRAESDVHLRMTGSALHQEANRAEHWRKSALIIVDMQNDFVRVGAPLEVADARGTIPNHLALIHAFRKRNLPIIFTKFVSHPHYYLLWDWSPQCAPPTKCCWKGHERFYSDIKGKRECTDIIDELRPEPRDLVIEKNGYGAFHETGLDKRIRLFGLNSVVITGTVTQICVEETAREAFHHGFRTTIAQDAVSSFAADLHAATIKNFSMKFGWVAESESIIASLA